MPKENLYKEHELLQLVAKSDRQAYRQLFDRYWDQVYGIGLRLTKSPEQAKDLAQDIFLKLWDNREKLPEIKNLRAYLFIISRNLIHDHIRTKVFRESNREFLIHYFSYHEASHQERLEQKELGEALHEAINQLPPKLHQVFMLSRFEGLSHEEIAQRLNITPLSSKTYMVRALMALRKIVAANSEKLLFMAGLFLRLLRF
ncbi:MAG TPA: RNA polymerase sigma-70 factor [Puia sp.]|nr:RNA polymerase sigma-70 factor [Puia sp.]